MLLLLYAAIAAGAARILPVTAQSLSFPIHLLSARDADVKNGTAVLDGVAPVAWSTDRQ